jgi:hypothetical protein
MKRLKAPVSLELLPAPRESKPHPRLLAEAERKFTSELQALKIVETAKAFLHDYATRLARVREVQQKNPEQIKNLLAESAHADEYAAFVRKHSHALLAEAAQAFHAVTGVSDDYPEEGYLARYGALVMARLHAVNETYSRFLNEAGHKEEVLQEAFARLAHRLDDLRPRT